MLEVLRRIVQEVSAARDLGEALNIMVSAARSAIETQSCSIFLIDYRHKQYVLMATDGLNPDAVLKVRFDLDEGLVGLVGQREEPINLEDAPSHEKFLFHPEAGEERFNAYLGVPIIHQRQLFGVLTVQQEEQRRFDQEEEAFLVTLSAQLAGVIATAEATGGITALTAPKKPKPISSLIGIAAVPGVGIGEAVAVYPPADLDAVPERKTKNIKEEIEQFNDALQATREEMIELGKRMAGSLPDEEHLLFDAYTKLLEQNSLGQAVIKEIKKKLNAQAALCKVIKRYVHQFEEMQDSYLQERAVDFRDLGQRVLAHLQSRQPRRTEYPERVVLVGEEVTAAALAEVPEGHLAGVVSTRGSSNSHVAIVARAMNIPTVMGAEGTRLSEVDGQKIVVDGYYGQVYLAPPKKVLKQYQRLAEEEKELQQSLETLRDEPAETPDGYQIALNVNIGLAADASLSLTVGADGVGLYRTEMPFMTRDRFPAEEEQRVIYRQLLKAFSPRPVTMRTLDIGGDKALPYFSYNESNPFLGWRGIRVTLDHPEVFLVQVRAMLRASNELNNLSIMLPMITGVGEFDEAYSLIEQAHMEIVEEGHEIVFPKVGIMVEVPAAVYQIEELAKRADFLSVGSNDLTQYMLAVDRNNARVAGLYDPLHPAVLRALHQTVQGAHAIGKTVSLCGEMASDPAAVILLLAMEFDMLSMNSASLLRVKWVIRNISKVRAKDLLDEVIGMSHPGMIRFRLEQALEEAGLGGLIRAGKA